MVEITTNENKFVTPVKPVSNYKVGTNSSEVQGSSIPNEGCQQVINKFNINNLILTPQSPEEKKEFEEIVSGKSVEEQVSEENSQKLTVDLFIENEIQNIRKFYKVFENDCFYDINLKTYIKWRKCNGAGKQYKECIDSSSLLMKLIMIINEREKMSESSRLVWIADKVKDKRKIGFPINSCDRKIYEDRSYNNWRFECHKMRYFYIRKYFLENCNFDIKNIRNESDIINYYKNDLAKFEYYNLDINKVKNILDNRNI